MVVVGKVVVPVVNGSVIYFVCENAVVKDSVVVIGADVVSVAVCDVVVLGEEVVIGTDVVSVAVCDVVVLGGALQHQHEQISKEPGDTMEAMNRAKA